MSEELVMLIYFTTGLIHIIVWAFVCRLTDKKRWPKIKNDSAAMGLLLIFLIWPIIDIVMPLVYLFEKMESIYEGKYE